MNGVPWAKPKGGFVGEIFGQLGSRERLLDNRLALPEAFSNAFRGGSSRLQGGHGRLCIPHVQAVKKAARENGSHTGEASGLLQPAPWAL